MTPRNGRHQSSLVADRIGSLGIGPIFLMLNSWARQWPEEEKAPTRYFLCDLPPSTTLRRLVRAAKSRWKMEQDYLQLKDELGLDI